MPKSSEPIDLQNDHNVFILGAGFSCEAGLPLMGNFLNRMRDAHPWLEAYGRRREADAVHRVLTFRLRASAATFWTKVHLENIEELFSLASAADDGLVQDIRLAMAATLDFCLRTGGKHVGKIGFEKGNPIPPGWNQSWLRPIKDRPNAFEVDLYTHHIARMLGWFREGRPVGRNTIITFNYDTLVETALAQLNIPFSYGLNPKTVCTDQFQIVKPEVDLQVLKLHGSVNWAFSPGRVAGKKRLKIFQDYQSVRDLGYVPELIPPTWRKLFRSELATVWNCAVTSLQTATRIFVIGFSIPTTDTHFKYLLAAGLQRNISLRKLSIMSAEHEPILARARDFLRPEHFESNLVEARSFYFGQQMLQTGMDGGGLFDRAGLQHLRCGPVY